MLNNYKDYMLEASLQIIKDKYEFMQDTDENRTKLKKELEEIIFLHKYYGIAYNVNGKYFTLERLYFLNDNPLDFKKDWKEISPITNIDIRLEVDK